MSRRYPKQRITHRLKNSSYLFQSARSGQALCSVVAPGSTACLTIHINPCNKCGQRVTPFRGGCCRLTWPPAPRCRHALQLLFDTGTLPCCSHKAVRACTLCCPDPQNGAHPSTHPLRTQLRAPRESTAAAHNINTYYSPASGARRTALRFCNSPLCPHVAHASKRHDTRNDGACNNTS